MPGLVSWSRLSFFSIVLAASINILFGFLRLVNVLGIKFNYFYSPRVVDIIVFSSSSDLWIWGASLLFIVLSVLLVKTIRHVGLSRWLVFSYLFLFASLAIFMVDDEIASVFAIPFGFLAVGLSVDFDSSFIYAKKLDTASLVTIGLTILLILVEIASVSSWILNAFSYEVPFGASPRWRFPWIDLQLFSVLYPLTVLLFLAVLYSWIWIPALRYGLSRIGKGANSYTQRIARAKLDRRFLVLGLMVCLAASVFVAYFPYIHLPDSTLVGVDSISYHGGLNNMTVNGPYRAFDTDRPLFYMLMYSIQYVTTFSPQTVVRIMPMVCAMCLCLAVFWFVKEGTDDERLALISSLFSSFAFQTTVSIFAYSLANWFAMIEVFLLLVFLLRSSKKHSWRYISISAFIGMALLLTHPYTWNIMMVILAGYLVWMFLRGREVKSTIVRVVILLAVNLLFYVFYVLMPFGGGLGHGEGTVLHSVGVADPFRIQDGLAIMVSLKAGGLFANPLILVLAIVGVFSIVDLTRPLTEFQRIMLLWIAVPSLALIAIPPGQELLYYRLVYLIPFQVLASLGLSSAVNKLEDMERMHRLSSRNCYVLRVLLFILVVLFLLNYSLRGVDEAMTFNIPVP